MPIITKDNIDTYTTKILNNIDNDNNYPAYQGLTNELYSIREYIKNNKNNPEVQTFLTKLALFYQKYFTTPELYRSFNLSEQHKYFKIEEIFKAFPFTLKSIYLPYYLDDLFEFDKETQLGGPLSKYKKCFKLFTDQKLPYPTQPQIEQMTKYVNDNISIMYLNKSTYHNLAQERKIYDDVIHNKIPESITSQRDFDANEYVHKILGNIGELYINNYYYPLIQKMHTARYLGDGFGYDIYACINQIEHLIEVKTTNSESEHDYFKITDKEYKVMLETFSNPYAKYLIIRVIYDHFLNRYKIKQLIPINEETLIDPYNNTTYKFNETSGIKNFKRY